jgi:ABC-type transport system involved in multi-copper enzyme maturation permease subunit
MRRPRIPRWELLGPLFEAELARLARQPTLMALKSLMVLALLFLLFTFYPHDQDVISVKAQSNFMHSLLLCVGGVQLAAIWLLTPWFAAAVLTEDREKKTLDLLLTTTLTDRDVVLGKLAARVIYVGFVVLAGVPVFAILLSFGGMSFSTIGLVYFGTLLNLVALAGLTVGCAGVTSSYRQTLSLTWVLMFVAAFCPVFGPAWFVYTALEQNFDLTYTVCFTLINLVVAILGVIVAVKSVRPWETSEVVRPMRVSLPVVSGPVLLRRRLPVAPGPEPKLTAEPGMVAAPLEGRPSTRPMSTPQRLLVDTVTKSASQRPIGITADLKWDAPPEGITGPPLALVMPVLAAAMMGVGLFLGLAAREPEDAGWMATMSMAWILVALPTCAGIAGTLSREREADTLLMLLTVPATRREILWRKVWFRLRGALWFWGLIAFWGALLIAMAEDHRYWGLPFVLQGMAMLVASVGLGVFLSVYCASTFLAQAAAIMLMLFAGVAPQWSWLTSLDGHVLPFLPLHAAALILAGIAGWFAALRSFENYCPK